MSAPHPMPNKRDVRRAFSRAAGTYDDAAVLQREVCARLMDKLSFIKITPQRVIDLGCGTGHSVRLLKQRFADAQLVGLDIALPMLEAMRGQRSLLARWLRRDTAAPLCADAEQLPLAGGSADLVFSNFTLQWCDAGKVFPEVARVLKPGGLFLFSLPGPDTLKELRNAFAVADGVHAVPHVNRFTDMHDIGDWLVQAAFADPVMDMEMLTMTYSTVKDVVRDLKAIGAVNSLSGRSRALTGKSRWQRMEVAYETLRKDGMLPATYEVIYGHAWKVERPQRTTADGRSIIEFRDYKKSTGT